MRWSPTVRLLLASCFALSVAAQGPPLPKEVQDAQARLAAGDVAGGLEALETYAAANPQRWGALRALAVAYSQAGQPDKALAVWKRLAGQPQFGPQAHFEIAAIHAQQKRPDEAFAELGLVRASGSFDMDLVAEDPRLQPLRGDPRFAALQPKPADFEKPFVEPVRVLYERRGEVKNGQFGWIARPIGDVDADEVADWVTSAPTFPVEGQPAGRIYVYSGRRGSLLWQQTGTGSESLGTGIEAAGDVDADGVPDVVAGAPGSGHAYVYSGRNGQRLLTLGGGDANDSFGRHATGAGDLNRDGHADIVVGAPGAKGGAGSTGVYSGKDGSLLLALAGEKATDSFGSTVGASRDPKHPFFAVGAPGAGPRGTGRVFVYRGLSPKPAFVLDSDETGGAFGAMFVSFPGDANGDRVPDVFVSDWANTAKGPSTGRVYLFSGADGKPLRTFTGERAGDGFGTSDSVAGDVDGDGRADLAVGAWQQRSGAPSGGKVYLYSGATGAQLASFTCRTPGDTFGFDTANLGDIDGDGTIDLLVTSGWSAANGYRSGRVFVISSGVKARAVEGAAVPQVRRTGARKANEEFRIAKCE